MLPKSQEMLNVVRSFIDKEYTPLRSNNDMPFMANDVEVYPKSEGGYSVVLYKSKQEGLDGELASAFENNPDPSTNKAYMAFAKGLEKYINSLDEFKYFKFQVIPGKRLTKYVVNFIIYPEHKFDKTEPEDLEKFDIKELTKDSRIKQRESTDMVKGFLSLKEDAHPAPDGYSDYKIDVLAKYNGDNYIVHLTVPAKVEYADNEYGFVSDVYEEGIRLDDYEAQDPDNKAAPDEYWLKMNAVNHFFDYEEIYFKDYFEEHENERPARPDGLPTPDIEFDFDESANLALEFLKLREWSRSSGYVPHDGNGMVGGKWESFDNMGDYEKEIEIEHEGTSYLVGLLVDAELSCGYDDSVDYSWSDIEIGDISLDYVYNEDTKEDETDPALKEILFDKAKKELEDKKDKYFESDWE